MLKKSYSNFIKIIAGAVIAIAAAFVLTQAPLAFAQGSTPSTTEPTEGDKGGFVICGNTAGNPCTIGHLFAAFIIIINYLMAMAGFVAVVAIVFAGLMMIYSQGQEQLKAAKGRFNGAIIGLVLIATAYILINSLFAGKLSVGVCGGKNILTKPVDYINMNKDECK